MIRLMKSNKGASSVLVILLLVVLVVFGVAALTTALSNVRLGQKVVDWNDKYYAAEAQANEMYAQIDSAVQDALPLSSGSHPDSAITDSVRSLDFEVETLVSDTSIDFMYEAWQNNVSVAVILTMSKANGELKITQWKVVQQ